MKKLLVLLLILMLSFGMVACGNSDEPDTDVGNPLGSQQQDEEQDGDDESGSEEPGKLNPDDLTMGEGVTGGDEASEYDDEFYGQFDFGFKVSSDFAMASTIKKLNYSDISAHGKTMESMLASGIEKVFGSGYDVFGDYEEDANDTIDKLAYAVGMENSESEASYMEAGVYHETVTDKHYQYTLYASDNAYDFSADSIAQALKELKDAYGITISQKTAEKAVKQVMNQVEKTQDYYSLYQEQTVSGSGYSELITVSVDGFCNEDGSMGYYFSVERERCYE